MLRIATWNIQRPQSNRSARLERVLQHIENVSADVWILTETHSAVSPGDDYQCVASTPHTRNAAGAENWVSIWSRLPIQPVEPVWDSRSMCCGNVSTASGGLLVYGTVLPWLGCTQYLPRRGKEAFLHALENQRHDWKRLRELSECCGICVAGDFNQDLGSAHYYGSKDGKAILLNVLQSENMSCLTSGEFDRIAASTEGRRAGIDHILISNDLLEHFRGEADAWPDEQEIDSGLTDHFGVWVDLQL